MRSARFVDHVDRLVGQLAIRHVAGGKLHRRLDGVIRVPHLVELLVIGLEALQNGNRIRDRWFVHVDLLEASNERTVLLEMLAVLLVGRRPDAAERAVGKRRLQQVGGIHGSARGGTGTNDRVDLVDEHDGARAGLDFLHHGLEALLEVTTVTGTGEKRAHVELVDRAVPQNLRHLVIDDLAGKAFGDGGLADTRVAHEQRIVLLATAQDLDGPAHLGLTPDQRIDLALASLLVEVDAIEIERIALALLLGAALIIVLRIGSTLLVLVDAPHRTGFRQTSPLGDAVGNVVHRIIAGHVLLLQEEGRMAFALGKDGDQHIRAGHLFTARGLDMDHGALDHALKTSGRLRILAFSRDHLSELVVDVVGQAAAQDVEIDVAGLHDGGGILVVRQREQQMFERRVLMAAFIGQCEGAVKRLFETAGECRHWPIPFPSCTGGDAGCCGRNPSPG